jgi:hypothetical protein
VRSTHKRHGADKTVLGESRSNGAAHREHFSKDCGVSGKAVSTCWQTANGAQHPEKSNEQVVNEMSD